MTNGEQMSFKYRFGITALREARHTYIMYILKWKVSHLMQTFCLFAIDV